MTIRMTQDSGCLFAKTITITDGGRGRARIVFAVLSAFLDIQEPVVTPAFNKEIA
jgi:hypothetical protein